MLPRMLRHFAATGDGLPPDGAVEVDAPDAGLRVVLSAARSGAWEPAAELLAQKWYGSHAEIFAFAESAAAAAPEGSPLRGLPLHAVTEYALEHEAGIGKGPVAWSRIEGLVEAGLELSARFEPGDRRAAGFRNHLALALIRSGREAEALEVFRCIATDACTFPWAYMGDPDARAAA
ncbi:hypothetical protein OIE43_43700 [Streptomyces pseudovenezuelae]|uniref:hypothetical protein n=1 Tax=Streptomyces pseudovenezuelae TaxID=67350 RepID=UPI002E342ECE|nr:hypothetical protein [Streptomyces pseudovenezuelae]